MYPRISPNQIHQLVLDRFQQHLTHRLADNDIQQRVRMQDGRVVAYCYRADNLFAMWMIDVGLVQFYDQAGNMLPSLDLLAESRAARRAA